MSDPLPYDGSIQRLSQRLAELERRMENHRHGVPPFSDNHCITSDPMPKETTFSKKPQPEPSPTTNPSQISNRLVDPYAELKAALRDGKTVEFLNDLNYWMTVCSGYLFDSMHPPYPPDRYRIKPDTPTAEAQGVGAKHEWLAEDYRSVIAERDALRREVEKVRQQRNQCRDASIEAHCKLLTANAKIAELEKEVEELEKESESKTDITNADAEIIAKLQADNAKQAERIKRLEEFHGCFYLPKSSDILVGADLSSSVTVGKWLAARKGEATGPSPKHPAQRWMDAPLVGPQQHKQCIRCGAYVLWSTNGYARTACDCKPEKGEA